MKLFNAQNHATSLKGEVLLSIGKAGNFQLLNASSLRVVSPTSFFNSENISVNYSYLGGLHICNYTLTSKSNSRMVFTLNSIKDHNVTRWDFANAVFKEIHGEAMGSSPVKQITLSRDTTTNLVSLSLTSFYDLITGTDNYLIKTGSNGSTLFFKKRNLSSGVEANFNSLRDLINGFGSDIIKYPSAIQSTVYPSAWYLTWVDDINPHWEFWVVYDADNAFNLGKKAPFNAKVFRVSGSEDSINGLFRDEVRLTEYPR